MIDWIQAGLNEIIQFVTNIPPVYVYFFFFGVAFTENVFPPIPGDTFTIVAGYLAANHVLNIELAFGSITVGTLTSVMLLYYLGRWKGRDYFKRKNFPFYSSEDVGRTERWFERYGGGTLAVSRFIVGARSAIALVAGMSRYPAGKMALYSYISAVLFHGLLFTLAYVMNAYIQEIDKGFSAYSKIILAIVSVLVILWIILIIRRLRRGA